MKRLLIFALLFCPSLAAQQIKKHVCDPTAVCLPGDTVNLAIPSPGLDSAASYKAALKSSKAEIPAGPLVLIESVVPDQCQSTSPPKSATNACMVIPGDAPDGAYSVQITKNVTDPKDTAITTTPAQITVQRPVISAVAPAGAFWNTDTDRSNTVVVLGKGFLRGANGKGVLTDDQLKAYTLSMKEVGTPDPCETKTSEKCYQIAVNNDQQITLTFKKIDAGSDIYKGKKVFSIAINGIETNTSTLTLIDTTAGIPKVAAALGFLLIVLIVFLLLKSGDGSTKQTMNGKEYWLSVLFYDVQTNSYSLSKCQFYAWTAAAVFGYLFLAVSKSIVQGSGVFPDIPPGLPGILIASVGTVVISTGITSAKGDKGAGNPGPNLSDFIASGGVVAPDRLQFAIWTLVGIGTFLSIVLQSDPRNINDLPTIPNGFLQLMGISSAGYLAGKLARKPGPTITAISVKPVAAIPNSNPAVPGMRFEITGTGLSHSAMFSVGDVQIPPSGIVGDKGESGAQVMKQDPAISDLDYGSVLALNVPNPLGNYFGKGQFTITNPDAQKATVSYSVFRIDQMTVTSAPAAVTIDGLGLDAIDKVQCSVGGAATAQAANTGQHAVWTPSAAVPAVGIALTVTLADSAGNSIVKSVNVT